MTHPIPPAVFPRDAFPPPPAVEAEAEPVSGYDGTSIDDTPAGGEQS
jgi:hypothetical protein